MKILFISNSIVGDPPGVSGGESRFIEIAKVWKDTGHTIHLHSSISGKKLCDAMGLSVIHHNLTNATKESRGEIVRRLLILPFKMVPLIKNFREGLVYSTSEQIYDVLPGVILKLCYPHKIKLGVVVHWLPPILFWKRKNSRILNSLLFLLSERSGLLLAKIFSDVMLPVSVGTCKELLKSRLGCRNIRVASCGVNINEVKHYRVADKKYEAVYMKRLQRVKGVFDLVDIWESVLNKYPDAKLRIIGEGIDGNRLRKLVGDKGLSHSINFEGVVYDPEIKYKMVSSAKLFLLPSYEENWAIVIGEALSSGTPVVCYDLPELREVWSNSITYAQVGSISDFSNKVIELLGDKKRYSEVRRRGMSYVKRYSWDKIAREELKWLIGENSIKENT